MYGYALRRDTAISLCPIAMVAMVKGFTILFLLLVLSLLSIVASSDIIDVQLAESELDGADR